jgi:hypothetical protein
MKFLWFSMVFFYLCLSGAMAQSESDEFACATPPVLRQAFSRQHPEAEGLFWERWDQGFKASFYENGSSREVCYSANGTTLQACTYLELEELPLQTRSFLTSRFPDWERPSLLAKVERPNHSVFYRVHFDLPEGLLELIFNEEGILKGENLDAYHREED